MAPDAGVAAPVLLRYGGDTIQLAPPFIATTAELDRLISVLGDALAQVARHSQVVYQQP